MLDLQQYAATLAAQGELIAALARALPADQASWKPTPADWSALEVLNHLYDEEREDFRLRLDLTLHQPDAPLPPIDPPGWVVARGYSQRDFGESLERFLEERQRSVAWLRGLESPDWERLCNHPHLIGLRAGDLLASWAAHDLLHLRQLIELRWAYRAADARPFTTDYAGEW